ncbi:hypothetical protein QUB60_26245 [Microcoleus sp. A2-C5]
MKYVGQRGRSPAASKQHKPGGIFLRDGQKISAFCPKVIVKK